MENLIFRKYYEYDDAFYKNRMNISCWEQMQYQSIRGYAVDYFLVFCDDINIKLSVDSDKKQAYVYPNALGLNDRIFTYINCTENPVEAEKSIEDILNRGKVVIFQTAMECLRTCAEFHEKGPYGYSDHNAIIVGCDKENFFYVDSPPMRNEKYFVAHRDNAAVGCISRRELLNSFQYHCSIGYIDINEDEIYKVANINQIITGIKNNFYMYGEKGKEIVGKDALTRMICLLKSECRIAEIFDDPFSFDLIASRHEKLKINIITYEHLLEEKSSKETLPILDNLIKSWRTIEKLAIKFSVVKDIKIQWRIANILEHEIIRLEERLIEHL